MKHLETIVAQYKERFVKESVFDDTISGEIKRVRKALLKEKFLPSVQLKALFNKLLRRAKYPMEVAIVGQFSSGKSTFLNALLSKDVLPTGITPVTSKVNFINYGEEYKLKVSYKNGANEYHALETIGQFTDQRRAVEDIKYLSLYAPMDILKDISFVDTPGLNSLSLSDTQDTKKILRDVDGIIWLTLIDNAGKESEAEVLNEYLGNFKEKSLCVLNQKDKFTKEEVDTTRAYIKERFSNVFSEVIPISAKEALDSRIHQKDVLIDSALHTLQKSFKESVTLHKNAQDLAFFKDDFEKFSKEIDRIEKHDNSDNKKMMESSNISEVLNYIQNCIRPQATASKEYSIKNDLSSICDILIKEYETIVSVYESLLNILLKKEDEILKAYEAIYLKHSKALQLSFEQIESMMQSIADTVYENMKSKEATYYKQEKRLFGTKIKSYSYNALYVDSESVMEKLFYENQFIDKQIKAILSHLENTQQQSSEEMQSVFDILKNAVKAWQEPYQLLKKNREIASDLEFANTRQFVAKVYENILLSYHSAIAANIASLHKKFAFFSATLSQTYMQLVQESLFMVQERVNKQRELYERDPLKNSILPPRSDEILEIVKKNFSFEKVELFLTSRRNYLYVTLEASKEEFVEINKTQIEFVLSQKGIFTDKIAEIQEIQKSLK